MKEVHPMRTITVEKHGKHWYARVYEANGTLFTQAGFTTKKAAKEAQEHWIEIKQYGEAKKG